TPATDLHALGVVASELVSGRLPDAIAEPLARDQSAGEAWDELEAIAVALLGPDWREDARLDGGAVEVPERRWRWQTVGSAAVLGAAIVVAVVTVVGATRSDPPDPVATAIPSATDTPTPTPTPSLPSLTRDETALTAYVQSRLGPDGQCRL